MARILLTGASGFVGRHCIEPLIARGWEVAAVTSRATANLPERDSLVWHQADLLDPAASAQLVQDTRPNALLHLAWHLAAGSLDNYHWARASLQLMTDFAEQGGRRAVVAGSCAEYDWHADQPLSEDSPRRPATVYGQCKNADGELFTGYCEEASLSGAWARIFFLYGPGEGESRLVASITRSLLAGKPAATTHGEQERDYLYVGDLGEALAALVDSEITGPINIASGRTLRLKELGGEIARQLGCPELLQLGAVAAHPDEAPCVSAEVSRLANELAWHPRFDLEEGVAETIAWWRARLTEAAT